MGLFFNDNDEDCIDIEEFNKRNFALDILIHHLIELANNSSPGNISLEISIDGILYDQVKEQLGSKFSEPLTVYGPLGKYTISKK